MSTPSVSVIIPHYRDLVGLDRCLSALLAQTLPSDQVEIIVSDNNSPEGRTAVERIVDGRARLIVVEEKGAGPARNGAVAVSSGDILAFIDSDCRAEATWLEEGLHVLPDYDFIGGRVTVLVEDVNRMTDTEAFERVFAFDFETYIKKRGFTGAGNLFCSRRVFDQVGPFRTGVSEDIEWSFRARAMGLRLGYAPKAIVGHPARRTWDELKTKWTRVNQERHTLARERGEGGAAWLIRSLALPLSAVAHVPKVLASDQLSTVSQRVQAIRMLFAVRFWRLKHAMQLAAQSK